MSFFPHDFIFQQGTNEDQDHQGLMFIKKSMSFSEVNHLHGYDEEDGLLNQEDEMSDECGGGSSFGGEKKKRLKREQVRELEKSFELGNKLDSERKQQLAKSLGLQQRQIAIWFQNRRARWKTKQLEKDYNLLKKRFSSAMAENDNLQSQNKKLLQEVLRGRESILDGTSHIKKEMADCRRNPWSNNTSENSCEINLNSTRIHASMNLFPSFNMSATVSHIPETSLGPDPQPSRVYQDISQDENLCNVLHGMDDQTIGTWSWAEQQHFGH